MSTDLALRLREQAARLYGVGAIPRQGRLAAFILVLLLALGTVQFARAAPAAGPAGVVRQFYAVLLGTMKNGPALGPQGRFEALEPAVRSAFDLASMSRLSVGAAWEHLAPAQRQQLSVALGRYTAATYADNFDSYSGEKLEVTGSQAGQFGTIVSSRLVPANGEPVTINYLMHQNAGAWQIGDVYLTGTISQLANLRAQFSAIVTHQGVDALIATLNRKADMLVAANSP
jgi:phospholipid transport system substrate-binding protein